MAVYFVVYLFIVVLGILIQPNKSKKGKKIFVLVSFGLIALIGALRKYTVGADLRTHYYYNYEIISQSSWDNLKYFTDKYEWGYLIFQKILGLLFKSPQTIIVMTSTFIFGTMGWFIYRNADNVYVATIFFISFMFYPFLAAIAQSMAIAILVISIELFLKKNKNIKFIIGVCLAASFHSSSILCVLLILVNNIKLKNWSIIYIAIIGSLFAIFYQNIFSTVTNILPEYNRYISSSSLMNQRAGYINLNSIINALILLIIFIVGYIIFSKKCNRNGKKIEWLKNTQNTLTTDFLIYTSFFAFLFRALVFKMNTLGRFSYFFYPFLPITVSRIYNNIQNNKNKEFCLIILVFLCTSYFGITTLFWIKGLFGIVPYKFFWQEIY